MAHEQAKRFKSLASEPLPWQRGLCPKCGCPGDYYHLWDHKYQKATETKPEHLILTCKSCGYSMERPCSDKEKADVTR